MSERRLTYTFGPLERRGLLGPVRAGQAAVIAAGGVGAIAALDASPSALGVLLAAALLAAAVARPAARSAAARRRSGCR